MNACDDGRQRVPDVQRAGDDAVGHHARSARKSAVVVANDPMPSVSKKLVTAPMPMAAGVGHADLRRGRCGTALAPDGAIMRAPRLATKTAVSTASAASSP